MKQLACEMCGSTDIVKQDGMFVCQSCGTKYSVEEAKKMMIEGTVEVQGTVKVDNSEVVKNYLAMAENAYKAGNNQEAEDYCNKVLEIVQTNSSAWKIKGLAVGWQSNLRRIRFEETVSCFIKAIKCNQNEFGELSNDEQLAELQKETMDSFPLSLCNELVSLAMAIIDLECNYFKDYCSKESKDKLLYVKNLLISESNKFIEVCPEKCKKFSRDIYVAVTIKCWISVSHAFSKATNEYTGALPEPSEYEAKTYLEQCDSCLEVLHKSLIDNPNSENEIKNNINNYKTRININTCKPKIIYSKYNGSCYISIKVLSTEAVQKCEDECHNCHNKIKELDPTYVVPERPTVNTGGCYVATCVYGSYDCPEVWTLRRYRDNTLGATWYGRAFIRTYYAISPTLVKWFGHTKWFKKMWQGKLDRMVKKLNDKGVANTPYDDIDWRK